MALIPCSVSATTADDASDRLHPIGEFLSQRTDEFVDVTNVVQAPVLRLVTSTVERMVDRPDADFVANEYLAVLHGLLVSGSTRLTVDDLIDRYDLRSSIERCEALLKSLFGSGAYLRQTVTEGADDGFEEVILEAHYQVNGSEIELDDLISLHDTFLSAYGDSIPARARHYLSLKWIATDADDREEVSGSS